jgi:transposase
MQVMYERCAGLDVHKKTVVAWVLTLTGPETRTFSTMTGDLLALADWLLACGCTHVAIESTGDYWKPVFNILEGTCEVILVNAQHVKAVPGRKTDVKDAAWLAELLQHGLLRASFIPPGGPAGTGLTGANAGKFPVTTLAKNYTFWPWPLLLRRV